MPTRPANTLRSVLGSRLLRLSAGMVLLSLCVLWLVDLSGLRSDGTRERQEVREAWAETLAVRFSSLASAAGPVPVESAIEAFVSGTPDVLGAVLTRVAGAARVFGQGAVPAVDGGRVDVRHLLVPILDGNDPWGELDIAFRPIEPIRDGLVYFGVVALALLVTYLACLGRALGHDDSNGTLPERIDNAFNMLVEGVIVLDERLRVLMVNEAAAAIVGKTSVELIGGSLEHWPWIRDEHWQSPWTTVLRTGLSIVDHPVRMQLAERTSYTINCSMIRDAAGRSNGIMVTLNDLSAIERKNRELSSTLTKLRRSQESITRKNRELEALAQQDPLTGLKNRRAIVEELAVRLQSAADEGTPLACIMVDIDHFKKINDTLGHAAGDEVICAVANVLVDQSRRSDMVGRIGGEEFVVVLPATGADEAAEIAGRVRASVERLAEEVTVPVDRLSASLGVAAHEAGVKTFEQLLDRADRALYTAKNGGRNRVVVFEAAMSSSGTDDAVEPSASVAEPARERARSPEGKSKTIGQAGKARVKATCHPERTLPRPLDDGIAVPTRESLELEADLHEALVRRQLGVHYQPKLRLISQRIVGMEALVRWNHPEKGAISPIEFIPLAERSGLIEGISAFVTETSLQQLARWHRAGFDELGMALNVSGAQLRDPELVPNILGALETAGVSSEHIEVELTEPSVIESPQRARIALGQLRGAGIRVSMDDFGTGYTSLALLADLPLDSVKIDRSFVDAMTRNDRSRAVVRSVVDMGRTLGLSVIGEGVETNEQLAMLAAFGCNDVQGYLISHPLDADAMSGFLERQAREQQPRKRA